MRPRRTLAIGAALVVAFAVVVVLGLILILGPGRAFAQAAGQSRTILVAEGGSYDVTVHPDFVTVFYLPDPIQKAIASDTKGYEVKPIGATSLAIRPLTADARPASLALVTASIKVSVVLRIARSRDEALTQVTFKRADLEAELTRRIETGVAERTAALEARIARMQATMDAALPALADGVIAARLLQRRERRALDAIARNDDNVVVEATEVFYLGDDAYLLFTVENRNRAPFRIATVEVRDRHHDRAALVRFTSDAAEAAGKGVLGVVRPGGSGAGVVVMRRAGELVGTSLSLVIAPSRGPGQGQGEGPSRGRVVVDRIVLR